MIRRPPRSTLFPYNDALPILREYADRGCPQPQQPRTPPAVRISKIKAALGRAAGGQPRSEEHTSELQSQSNLVCRLLLEKKKISNLRAGMLSYTSRIHNYTCC